MRSTSGSWSRSSRIRPSFEQRRRALLIFFVLVRAPVTRTSSESPSVRTSWPLSLPGRVLRGWVVYFPRSTRCDVLRQWSDPCVHPKASECTEHCQKCFGIIRVFIRRVDFFVPTISQPFAVGLFDRIMPFHLGVFVDDLCEVYCRNDVSFIVRPSGRHFISIVIFVVNLTDLSGGNGVRWVDYATIMCISTWIAFFDIFFIKM